MRLAIVLLLAIMATACSTPNVREQPATPIAVEIERRVYVPVPAELTTPAIKAQPRSRYVRELRRVAKERGDALDDVNVRLRKIRELTRGDE